MSGADAERSFLSLALRGDVVRRALKFAAVVGTVLVTINHAPALVRGDVTAGRILQILLTYCVPYLVTTLASVQAIRAELVRAELARVEAERATGAHAR